MTFNRVNRIAVLCNDTRGGVQPYVALADGLAKAGHDVRAVAPANLSCLFDEAGIAVKALSGTTQADLGQTTSVAERGSLAAMRFMATELPRHITAWTRETLEACDGADRLIGGVGGMVIGLSVAEKLGIPFTPAHLQPVGIRTASFPGVMLPQTPQWPGGWANRLSQHLSDMAVWMPFKRAMGHARRDVLGLDGRAVAAEGQPVLYGFSRHVLDIGSSGSVAGHEPCHTTGYWLHRTDPAWAPPTGLEAFLSSGKPVVSIGFGSMASHDPDATIRLIRDAASRAGVKAVVLSGWSGMASAVEDDTLFLARELPHDWLFSRVSAIVHHGGAGTTGAALTAGVPSVVVPFAMDQPFWGRRVANLGAGPQPIPRKTLTSDELATALETCLNDQAMRDCSTALGNKLKGEDGVAEAVKIIGSDQSGAKLISAADCR
jgi:sterol 3beta-glucosyltransferase